MSNNQTIKNLRVKNNETSVSQVLPIGADAVNVELANRRNLQETIGNIDSRINGSITNNLEVLSSAIQTLDDIKADTAMIGSPLLAATASQMIDTSHIYVYTGSESGYTAGNWYYHNGTSWVSGGVYNSAAVETDKTLKVENVAADSKAAGNIVLVSETQPAAASNKIWIDPDAREISVPTMDDFDTLAGSVANLYDQTSTYAVGDYCMYEGQLYKCSTAINAAQDWTAAHWAAQVLTDNIQTDLSSKVNSPGSNGTSGQVLTTNGNGTTSWTTPLAVDNTLSQTGKAADAKKTGDEINDLKDDLAHVVVDYTNLAPYLYKQNIYINTSEIALNGYDVYKYPVTQGDIILVEWTSTEHFWRTLSSGYAFRLEETDDTYRVFQNTELVIDESQKKAVIIVPTDAKNVCICSNRNYYQSVSVFRNYPTMQLADGNYRLNYVATLTNKNALNTRCYLNYPNGVLTIFASGYPGAAYFMKAYAGDKLAWSETTPYVSRHGAYKDSSGNIKEIPLINNYTFTENCIACIYYAEGVNTVTYYPAQSIKIDANNVVNDASKFTQFANKKGVAFGTSITYRALTTGGFLEYLPALCGATFDNQGLGSSSILPNQSTANMLAKIKAYTDFTDKDFVLFEGFVNDWYYNATSTLLGEYTDNTESTVCGCIRSAINYIWTQKPYITIIGIIDHVGRTGFTPDTSSTAQNSGGLTQYEYYSKVKKVFQSLSIPVICLDEFSQMNEYTPNYYIDNIHPSALGAEHTAKEIWSRMKDIALN